MIHFTPTLGARDTAQNTKDFITANMETFWTIFKPLAPYIAGLTVLDLSVSVFILGKDPETDEYRDFALGGLVASYFYTCLVISWHRVVIHGADKYEPMNPFKPQKSELIFIGMGILIGVSAFIAGVLLAIPAIVTKSSALLLLVFIGIIGFIYLGLKICFYFPSKATGNTVTFRQSFDMTKGLILKLLGASLLAAVKTWLLMLAYVFVGLILLFAIGFVIGSILGEGATDIASAILGFLYALPLALYFQPLLTVIGVTVLSNYYQHAMQNKPLPATPEKSIKDGSHEDMNKTRKALDNEGKN